MFRVFRKTRGIVAGCMVAFLAVVACDESYLPQPPMAVPKFEAVYADSINLNSVRLNALVSNPGMLTSFGFVIQADSSIQEITLKAQTDIDTIRAWADNLKPQNKYFFWAKADNGGGITITSDTVSFETLSVPVDTSSTIVFEDDNLRKWIVLRYDSNNDDKIDAGMRLIKSTLNFSKVDKNIKDCWVIIAIIPLL